MLRAMARSGAGPRLAGFAAGGRPGPGSGLARLVMFGEIGCVTWRQRGARRGDGGRNTMLTNKEAGEAGRAAKARLGVTWAQLADAVGRPVAWTT